MISLYVLFFQESNPLSEVVAVIEEALFNFLEKRDSHYHSSLFHTILEKRPVSSTHESYSQTCPWF